MKISPVEKAKAHFEEAIIQYLDKKNFIISTTLAGVAEEILGKILPQDRICSLQEISQTFGNPPEEENCLVTGYFTGEPVLTEKLLSGVRPQEIIKHLNFAKNSIKHSAQEVDINPEDEAKNLLNRALDNYFNNGLEVNPTIERITQHFFPDLKYDYQQKVFAVAK